MAWLSSGTSNSELIENLWRHKLITDERVKNAMLKVDRAHYAPSAAYTDSPQSIGFDATISAPHMHAHATESLLSLIAPTASNPAPRVLDIGSGSGYLTHVLAELVGDRGVVVGVEHIKGLRDLGEKNMGKSAEGRELLASGRVRFRIGDGRKGWTESEADPVADGHVGVGGPAREPAQDPKKGGWDAIHVGAAAVKLHEELIEQLRSPGRLFIPVEDEDGIDQYIWTVDKDEKGNVTKTKLYGVRYVPLTDAAAKWK